MGLVTERAGKAAYGVLDRDTGPRRPSPADRQQVQPGGDTLLPRAGASSPTHSWHLRGLLVPEPSACLSQRDEVAPPAPSEGKQLEKAAAPWP